MAWVGGLEAVEERPLEVNEAVRGNILGPRGRSETHLFKNLLDDPLGRLLVA